MQFDVKKTKFTEALQKIIGVVERRHAIAILTNIHIAATEHEIRLTATDLEIQLSSVTEAECVQHAGQITVPGRKLFDIVKNLPNENFKAYLEKDTVIIESGNSRFSLKTLSAEEFPRIEYGQAKLEFTIGVTPLKRLIEQAAFAIANQDVRYYLNGLLFEISPHYFRSVATDGHRLALITVHQETSLPFEQFIIPRKSILELARILNSELKNIQLALGDNFLSVKGDNFFYVSKLIEGRYPNYHSVIPQDLHYSIVLEKDYFKQAISRIMVLLNEKYQGVRFQLMEQTLIIESKTNEQEEAREQIPVEFSGEGFDVGFNASYFIDALSRIHSETFELIFSGSNQSAYIKQVEENSEDIYVIMPMLL